MKKLEGVTILNDGNPIELGKAQGYLFTVSPSTAKKNRGYYTDKKVTLTNAELKMPGVVVCQNRGMMFSSCREIAGDYVIPNIGEMNIIVVDEASRTLWPEEDNENKIAWKGNGEHSIKDVIADGQGQHWFCTKDGKLAVLLWFKIAKFGYGIKGMIQPGLATDIGRKIIDHWGVERTVILGNTLLLNSSLVKGLSAYNSLEELVAHAEEWGLTTMMKQWQSGDHKPAEKRIMGTQPNSTNLMQIEEEITELLRPEALKIWAMQFEQIAWMKTANIRTSRGRAIAARPNLLYKDLMINQINSKCGNDFLRLAKGQFMAEARYLKMFVDKLVYSYVYVHGMDPNEAAKKAAETGLHGEIRVNPSFAGRHYVKDEDGKYYVVYDKETHLDNKGRYIVTDLVRYPHGAPSETIEVKAYLDDTCPDDVILFPAPVADENGHIPVKYLYAFRLQGADFDGDAVTAFTEKVWLEAQRRNIGKPWMVIPVNTEGTEKDKTLVTDETFEQFCEMKVDGLSNRVGLIATSLKYFFSQYAKRIREGEDPERDAKIITDHACAMGDDIDEFKHGKANNDLVPFVVPGDEKNEYLQSPYFNRYARKYKADKDLDKAIFDKFGNEKTPGSGVLDTYAATIERLMWKGGIPVVKEVSKASDGKDRFYFTVKPVRWAAKEVDLFEAGKGESPRSAALPDVLAKLYGLEPGTMLSAKELFQLLYRDHAATCATLMDNLDEEEDKSEIIKSFNKINERYALAKVAIVAWAKEMKKQKGEEVNAIDALKAFTTLLIQHTAKSRSAIDVFARVGKFSRVDGSVYEKTVFDAQRVFNYFLDVCGDGLLFLGEEAPVFPEVNKKYIETASASAPDMDKAKELALKEMTVIEKLVSVIPSGIENVIKELSFDGADLSADELRELFKDDIVIDVYEDDMDYAC